MIQIKTKAENRSTNKTERKMGINMETKGSKEARQERAKRRRRRVCDSSKFLSLYLLSGFQDVLCSLVVLVFLPFDPSFPGDCRGRSFSAARHFIQFTLS